MIKNALKSALLLSTGITLGIVLLPRVFSEVPFGTISGIIVQLVTTFIPICIACFMVFMLAEWRRSKKNTK